MSNSREQFEFGHGSFVGQIMSEPEFFDLSHQEQARIAGWVDGCPVVEELIDPANTAPGRGPENMLQRYSGVNFWFGYIAREVEDHNPVLGDQLMAPLVRHTLEPVGKHEPESVPDSYETEMYPMNTLAGYALPRIFLEQLGDGEPAEVADRMVRGLQALEEAIPEAESPLELLALVGEGLVKTGDVTPEQVLKHSLSQGWLGEHNATRTIVEFQDILTELAPTLWGAYQGLGDEEKQALRLV